MGSDHDRTGRESKKKELLKWRDVLKYCIGEVGLRPDEFWSMTFAEVEAACRGYEVRLARSKELDRFIASVLLNANRKKGTRAYRPEEIMPLITDRKKVELVTVDEYDRLKNLKVEWQTQN